MRLNELREALQLRLSGELMRFTDDELKAVVSLLSGPGVVWEFKLGSRVLLQPGRIIAHAQSSDSFAHYLPLDSLTVAPPVLPRSTSPRCG